jgi:hypothetical protein
MFYVLHNRLYTLISREIDMDVYVNVATGDVLFASVNDIWSSRWGSCDPKRIYV